ncbi:hypothetical protein [Streptomyces sp. NPDC005538]|uniref:hypothetical protein n=1 Tax=Streptomyces sp. NPDC005538 TaxID=3157043 RepID=UPI0033B95C74
MTGQYRAREPAHDEQAGLARAGHAQSWVAPRIEKVIYEVEAAVGRVLDLCILQGIKK